MKRRIRRFAQTQETVEPTEQNVALSPRLLLTGPRQMIRLEQQARILAANIQDAMTNLTRTKDNYISALQNLAAANAYMTRITPRINRIFQAIKLNTNTPTEANVSAIEFAVQQLASESEGTSATPTPAAAAPAAATPAEVASMVAQTGNTLSGLANRTNIGRREVAGQGVDWSTKPYPAPAEKINAPAPAATPTTTATPTSTAPTPEQTAQMNAVNATAAEQSALRQRLAMTGRELNVFRQTMLKELGLHQQRAKAVGGQYLVSKTAYAQQFSALKALQNDIDNLNMGLSGWVERLSEFYAPAGSE